VARVPAAKIEAVIVEAVRRHIGPDAPVGNSELITTYVRRIEVRRTEIAISLLREATPEGRKELVGFTDGSRESAQDWCDLLLDLKRRRLDVRPELAIADGALGF
jgi:hypothetical protein